MNSDILNKELYHSFLYFLKQANLKIGSTGFGLISDDTKTPNRASIAAVGFGLTMYVIGVENGYLTKEAALRIVKGTFDTFLNHISHIHGFYVHYCNLEDGTPYKKSEYSTIDTILFLNGAIVCDAYFNDEELHGKFNRLVGRVNFKPFIMEYKNKLVFRMAYNPHLDGDYRGKNQEPWIYHWHMYAEQLSMYFLAAGKDDVNQDTALKLYNGFERNIGKYREYEYIYCPTNALFIYQYSHAWFDFKKYLDPNGFDWFKNSVIATKANKAYCLDMKKKYSILGQNAWGLTACITPVGYRNQVVEPHDLNTDENHIYGVLPPSGALGSIPFVGEESVSVAQHLINDFPESFGPYGFYDGLTFVDNKLWIAKEYVGINKGITGVMIDNYLHGTVYELYMSHPYILKAIKKLGFKAR
ncbi:MAG: glucoamylase family protein [Candidatus Izemoplasmatales bacterium]|nr:glucoamylase family protein [Candidatus Izemoplasmatales bacterium]